MTHAVRTPYASIVVPTHDRETTLEWSVRSVMNQTVHDIEIIIVGDGCTEGVREVAQRLAREDRRIRFLDCPKAPLRGAANRDFAVRSSSASFIFYNDDDDLLLPSHVELLAAVLESADIVDTPPASVGTEGRVALGLHDSRHPLQRRLLLEERFKGVFDTHLGHRKSAYTDRAPAWMNASDHRVVLHMLKAFAAAPELKWVTLNRVTALSFHGARRVTMPAAARERELATWTGRINDHFEAELRRDGGYAYHVLRLADSIASETECDRLSLLAAIGAIAPAASSPAFEERHTTEARVPGPWTQHTPRQRAELDAVLALAQGDRPDPMGARIALDELLDPVLSPDFSSGPFVQRFSLHFGIGEIDAMLRQMRTRSSVDVARIAIRIRSGATPDALHEELRAAFDAAPEESRFFLALAVARELAAMSQLEAAWSWMDAAAALAPESRHALGFWHDRSRLAQQLSHDEEASDARRRITVLDGSMV